MSDPDGVDTITTTEWCWERSPLPTFSLADAHRITCASTPTTMATYTPVDDDLGHHLRATVTYTDSQGTLKREAVAAVTTETVSARPQSPPPRPPSGPPGGPPSGGGPPGGGGPACAEDLHGNSAAQATDIALATETAGAICPAADVDYFTVTAPGQGLVFVDTTGSVNLRGTLWQHDEVLASGPTRAVGRTTGSVPASRPVPSSWPCKAKGERRGSTTWS